MESQLSISVLIGFVLIVHSVLVESQIVLETDKDEVKIPVFSPPPPPLLFPPPPPPSLFPPPPPEPALQSAPPPPLFPPPPPPLLQPPPPQPQSPPPALRKRSPPPSPRFKPLYKRPHIFRKRPPPPPPEPTRNTGKKVGLLFAGVAAIMQICFAGFLVYKRRQLF